MIHKHTFGKDRGAEVFVEVLNESPEYMRKRANKLLQKYILELEQLQHVKSYRIKMQWLLRIRNFYKEILIGNNVLSKKIKDFGNNVITTLYRNKVREWEIRSKRWYRRRQYQKNKNEKSK